MALREGYTKVSSVGMVWELRQALRVGGSQILALATWHGSPSPNPSEGLQQWV